MVLQNKTEYWGNNYGYDAWGNLLQKSITKCGAENLSVTADAHNWLHAAGTDYQYDAAGNMIYDATASLSYVYDQENRLNGAAGYTYTYDANGNRVRKSNGNPWGGELQFVNNDTNDYKFTGKKPDLETGFVVTPLLLKPVNRLHAFLRALCALCG